MFSFAFKAARAVTGAKNKLSEATNSKDGSGENKKAGGVNWDEYNYPPCLTIVHFDPVGDTIPMLAKTTVLRMRLLWYYAICILFFNFWSNVGFVAAKSDEGIVIFYSGLQFCAGTVAGGCVLYQGYRGVAGDLVRNSRIYLWLQGVLTVFMILFASIQSGNLHGFSGITSRQDTASQPAYLILCIVESVAWLVCTAGSVFCMYRVYRYPGHERAQRYEVAATKNEEVATQRKKKRAKQRETEKENDRAAEEETAEQPAPKKQKKHKAPAADADEAV
jgi:hypothetical protein